jgi:hypothetical protein
MASPYTEPLTASPTAESPDRSGHRQRRQTGLVLVGITMAYNALEAVIALWTAYRDHSVSLEAFGLDGSPSHPARRSTKQAGRVSGHSAGSQGRRAGEDQGLRPTAIRLSG